MTKKPMLGALAIAAVTVAILSTAAIAQQGNAPQAGNCTMDGAMMGQGMRGGMMGGMGDGMGPMAEFDFAAIDTDKDGKITSAEFTAFRTTQAGAIDANKDGKLSADELSASRIAAMTSRIQAMTEQMVTMNDTDGDGLLSVGELAARPMPTMMFDRIDANSDGSVTQEEVDAATQMMGQRGGEGRGGWFSGMMGGRGDGHGKHGGHGNGGPDGMGMGQGMGGMGNGPGSNCGNN